MTTTEERVKKLRLITPDEAADFIAGDALICGKRRKLVKLATGQWIVEKMVDQWVARFCLSDAGEHVHMLCDSHRVAKRIYVEAVLEGRKDLIKRFNSCVSWSYGLQEDWMKNPAIFLDEDGQERRIKPFPLVRPFAYEDKEGNPSEFRGPYGLKFEPREAPGPCVWIEQTGAYVPVGEVPDLMIDTTLTEDTLNYVEKQMMLHERRMWADAVRAGELPAFTE